MASPGRRRRPRRPIPPSAGSICGSRAGRPSGQEFTEPLADIGCGTHVFVDFTWRRGRFLLGLNARYQWAFDIININCSNLRYGAHLGMAF